MYYPNRLELGNMLAGRLQSLRSSEPIVLCLKESAMPVCISIASQLRGWIYPLLVERIIIPGDPRIIGVINQDGMLCYNEGLPEAERESLHMDYQTIIQEASREAFGRLNRRLEAFGDLNKKGLFGRKVIIVGDVVKDRIEISAAKQFLKSVATDEIISAVGNIEQDSSTALFVESQQTTFLDIMQIQFDEGHYFEQADNYSVDDQRAIAMNISQYWV